MVWQDESVWRLGLIEETSLGFEDHGILTYNLRMGYYEPPEEIKTKDGPRVQPGRAGSGQGAGNVFLGGEHTDRHVRGILKAVGVSKWEDLKGQWVWALQTHTKVIAIVGVRYGSKEPFEISPETTEKQVGSE